MGNSPDDMMDDLNEIKQCVHRLVDDLRLYQSGRLMGGTWCPPADVYESETTVVVEVEIPDVPPQHLDISVRQNMLTLRGERKFARCPDRERYHRIERSYGTFCRVFSLPVIPEPADVAARYANGVLHISIPKGTKGSRKIPVR